MESKSDGNPLIPPSPHTHHINFTLLCLSLSSKKTIYGYKTRAGKSILNILEIGFIFFSLSNIFTSQSSAGRISKVSED